MQSIEQIILNGESDTVEFKSSFNSEVIEMLTAFANTKGGSVYIGISEKGMIIGITISAESVQQWVNEIKQKTSPQLVPDVEIITLNENRKIIKVTISEYPVKPVAMKGRFYKRTLNSNHGLSAAEVVDMHLKSVNSSWDFYTNQQKTIDDISFEKVQIAIDKIAERNGSSTDNPISFLQKYELIKGDYITNACYLLFSKNDTMISTIELGHFASDIVIKDSITNRMDIVSQVESVFSFIKKHINKEIIITESAENTQRWQYPLEAVRELILNMIIHRDYMSSYDSIVKIYSDHILFYNPGVLPESISIENLFSDDYISTPRNRQIAQLFKDIGLIEKYGSGIRRILRLLKEHGLPLPEFKNQQGGFIVKIYDDTKKPEFSKRNDFTEIDVVEKEQPTEKTVEKTVEKIIEVISKNPQITQSALIKETGLSRRGVEWNIKKLKELGMIKRIGPDKGGNWEVINKVNS
jgi:ATP-dependent DNA helicase RecG